jgi:glucose-6-phosphate-specific signal transduction histidine kinase
MSLSEKRIAAAAAARNCARIFDALALAIEDETRKISDLCEPTAHAELELTDRILDLVDSEEGAQIRQHMADRIIEAGG